MKKFVQFKNDDVIHELQSRTARDAALKAASSKDTQIILIESDKLYIYEGKRTLLNEHQHNDFTRSNNIHYKPSVRKMHYEKLSHVCNLKKDSDIIYVKGLLSQLGIVV